MGGICMETVYSENGEVVAERNFLEWQHPQLALIDYYRNVLLLVRCIRCGQLTDIAVSACA